MKKLRKTQRFELRLSESTRLYLEALAAETRKPKAVIVEEAILSYRKNNTPQARGRDSENTT